MLSRYKKYVCAISVFHNHCATKTSKHAYNHKNNQILIYSGIQGIAAAYQHSVHHVKLSAPTCMSPIINHVAAFAREQHSSASVSFIYKQLEVLLL